MTTNDIRSTTKPFCSGNLTDEETESTRIIKQKHRYIKIQNSFSSKAVLQLIESPDSYLNNVDTPIIKSDATSTVGHVTVDGESLIVKRYNIKGPLHALKRAPRPSRAENNWRYSRLLTSLGVLTPKVVAIIEHRYGPFRGRAYLIQEKMPGELLLDLYQNSPPDPSSPSKLQFALVDLFKSLWINRISHGDMKATNILINNGKPILLDLDATRQHRNIRRLKFYAEKDEQRFLKNWRGIPELHTWFGRQLNELKQTIF